MTVDIVNYNNLTHNGLLHINVPDDKYYSFDNIYLKDDNNLISIYDYFNIKEIYVITKNHMSYNECNTKGLYFIEQLNANDKVAILIKINEDESELIANIDSNSNFIIIDTCKLYKAGNFDKNLYYCYECGKYIWK